MLENKTKAAANKDETAKALAPVEKRPKPVPAKKTSRSLVPSDPLQHYLQMVRQTHRLSEDETHQLAVQVYRYKDRDAALKLVTAHLRLVVNIAFSFQHQFQNMLDLIQEGNIGLMRAIEKFDPFRGVQLSSYATYWIRAYILKYILDNWRLVKVGTTNMRKKLLFNLNKVTNELRAAGIDPAPKRLAAHFKASEADIVAVQRSLGSSDVSLDAPAGDDSERTYAEVIGEEEKSLEEALGAKQISELVRKHVDDFAQHLRDSDRTILYKRLMSDEPLTLAEIGEKHGVTREAVRQAEARLKKRLKKYLEGKIPGLGEISFTQG
jgi:RNA polymerase sigma-32 factor